MLQTREAFITSRVLDVTRDARIAVGAWDPETIARAAQSLLACADQMRKMAGNVQPVPLDDSVPLDCLSQGHSAPESDEGGDGGHKVEADTPEPVLPSGGVAADPVAALDGLL